MSLRASLDRHRFELFYASLVLCGSALAVGEVPVLLTASEPADVPPTAALLLVGGFGLAATGAWEALHRDREEWAADRGSDRLQVWLVICAGAIVAGGLTYAVVA